jgi:hypothetical protein
VDTEESETERALRALTPEQRLELWRPARGGRRAEYRGLAPASAVVGSLGGVGHPLRRRRASESPGRGQRAECHPSGGR